MTDKEAMDRISPLIVELELYVTNKAKTGTDIKDIISALQIVLRDWTAAVEKELHDR